MPISPLTPLSLVASVNLQYLRDAFEDLEKNHGFYVDPGTWCCTTCARSAAWDEGAGQPFVFWHEQNEEGLHEDPSHGMCLYFGVSTKDASDQEIGNAAKKIISVLSEHDIICDWEDGDLESALNVHLDTRKPCKDGPEPDRQTVCLYIPENKDTKEFCCNESEEDCGEPKDTYNFYQEINDGESLKDAILRLDQKVWRHISHYQRSIDLGIMGNPVEPVFEIDQPQGGFHSDCDESLLDLLKEASKEEVQFEPLLISDNPLQYLAFLRKKGYEFELSSKGVAITFDNEEAKKSFHKNFKAWKK